VTRRTGGRWAGRISAVAALLLLTACGSHSTGGPVAGTDPAAVRVISVPTLRPGAPVPTPSGPPVFTVTGKISATNRGETLALDRATVESLGVVQATMYEPWTKKTTTFRGVWLKDLVELFGVPDDATGLHITALDDYAVDLKLSDVRAGGIMLATRAADGSDIPIDQGGPSRIVFLDGVAAGANADQWVWSIKEIAVR
jgi:hypothetical protein